MITIKKLQKLCHQIAKEKGFWSEECDNCLGKGKVSEGMKIHITIGKTSRKKIIHKGRKYNCDYCNGTGQVPKPRNDGEMVALMHSELSEVLEALRKNDFKHVGEELADCVIRILDYCGGRNIDLEKEVLKKIEKNKKRKFKHGKLF